MNALRDEVIAELRRMRRDLTLPLATIIGVLNAITFTALELS